VSRATITGLKWTEAVSLTDAEIENRLFPAQTIPETKQRPLPDFNYIYDQLRAYQKLNLTLAQLWLEYKEKHADGYQYIPNTVSCTGAGEKSSTIACGKSIGRVKRFSLIMRIVCQSLMH